MLGSAFTVSPADDASTTNIAGLPLSCAATMKSSASAAAGTSDFTPSSRYPLGVRTAVVLSAVGSNSACGSAIATHACGRSRRELPEVGGLLIGAAPMRQRRRHAAGRQDGQRQSHVAVGQRLGDHALVTAERWCGDTVEVLGDVDRGDAEFRCLGAQVGG